MKYITTYSDFKEPGIVRIGFIGDIMQHERQIEYYKRQNYNMYGVFDDILPILKKADFLVGNFENTFSGSPYTYRMPKEYISFSVPDEFVNTLDKILEIDLLNLAQNHILDRGIDGLLRTTNIISNNNMMWVGVKGQDSISLKIKKMPFRFYNYTTVLNTKSLNDNTIGGSKNIPDGIVSMLPDLNDINLDPDYINILSIHWGREFSPQTNEQKKIARRLIDKGFFAVIGSHSHDPIPSQYDGLYKRLVNYSLGNFISDQDHEKSPFGVPEKGYILILHIDRNGVQKYEEYKIASLVEPSGKTKIKLLNDE